VNYYEHHIRDYDADTAHLSWLEDMAYTRLLRLYYRKEAPIPADIAQACRLVRAHTKAEKAAVENVLNEFFKLHDDGWHHDRCDEEIASYRARQEKAARSAEARWAAPRAQATRAADAEVKHLIRSACESIENCSADASASSEQCSTDANAMLDGCERNAHQTPDTIHITPPHTLSGVAPPSCSEDVVALAEHAKRNARQMRAHAERTAAEPRGTRLLANWQPPPEWLDWARKERPDLDASDVAQRFRDYWTAKPGRDGRKLDWAATWRNWVRNERPPRAADVVPIKQSAKQQPMSFAEREELFRRRQWEEMTGRKWPQSSADTIDGHVAEVGDEDPLQITASSLP